MANKAVIRLNRTEGEFTGVYFVGDKIALGEKVKIKEKSADKYRWEGDISEVNGTAGFAEMECKKGVASKTGKDDKDPKDVGPGDVIDVDITVSDEIDEEEVIVFP